MNYFHLSIALAILCAYLLFVIYLLNRIIKSFTEEPDQIFCLPEPCSAVLTNEDVIKNLEEMWNKAPSHLSEETKIEPLPERLPLFGGRPHGLQYLGSQFTEGIINPFFIPKDQLSQEEKDKIKKEFEKGFQINAIKGSEIYHISEEEIVPIQEVIYQEELSVFQLGKLMQANIEGKHLVIRGKEYRLTEDGVQEVTRSFFDTIKTKEGKNISIAYDPIWNPNRKGSQCCGALTSYHENPYSTYYRCQKCNKFCKPV